MLIYKQSIAAGLLVSSWLLAPTAALAQANPEWIESARHYAREAGISEADAIRRLRLQSAISDLQARLETEEAETFAGIYIEESLASYGFVALFTDDPQGRLARHNTDPQLAGLGRPVQAARSRQWLRDEKRRLSVLFAAAGVPNEAGVDLRAQGIVVSVLDLARARTLLQAANIQIPEFVRLRQVPNFIQPETAVYGGNKAWYPTAPGYCTFGFAVRDYSGNRGISTAGHCSDDLRLGGHTGASVGLLQQQNDAGIYDVQWHRNSTDTYTNVIRYSTTSVTINGATGVTAQSQTAQVCKMGNATGITCGRITLFDYGTRDMVEVSSPGVNLSEGGDSGGPWYMTDRAYGIHHGGIGDNAYYMPIDRLSGISVVTQTTP